MEYPMDKTICGAKSRSNGGAPCKLSPLANGRCRFHGGKTPIKHGLYTKKAVEERQTVRALLKQAKNMLESDSVAF